MNGYSEVEYTPVENIYGKAYKRTCPFCGDLVVVSRKAIEFENYCRFCGKQLKGYEELRDDSKESD